MTGPTMSDMLRGFRKEGRWCYPQASEAKFRRELAAFSAGLEAWERDDMAARVVGKVAPRPKCWPTSAVAQLVLEEVRRLVVDDDAWWSFFPKGGKVDGRTVPDKGLVIWDRHKVCQYVGTVPEYAAAHGLTAVKAAPIVKARTSKAQKPVRAPRAVSAPKAVTVRPSEPDRPTATVPSKLGDELAAYLARLLHEPKRDYATALAAHLLEGGPAPTEPDAEWAPKVAAKVKRYATA
jgi:hypothetical protein